MLWNKSRLGLRFEGSCFKKEDTAPFTLNNVVKLFIIYELNRWPQDLNSNFTLKDCLFGAVKLTKNVNSDKNKYSSYSIGFIVW